MSLSVADRYADCAVEVAGCNLIDGAWRPGAGDAWQHINPASNEHLADIAIATPDEVNAAVSAARQAFDTGPWPRMRPRERKALLRRVADALAADAETINVLQTLDNGMPFSRSSRYRSSATMAADLIEYYAGWTDKVTGETFPSFTADDELQFMTVLEPIGVVAAITAWNAPVLQFANKVAPALAAGCTIVLKPSELASLASLRMAQVIAECDLPAGVLNVVTGTGPVTGNALVNHPGVDKITFTGSRAVGEQIIAASARGIRRVALELGGKSPALVFPDAPDLAAAAAAIGVVVFHGLSGQTCSAQTRALVHVDVYHDFLKAITAEARSVVMGDPFDPATTTTPIITRAHRDRIEKVVENGRAAGHTVTLAGGAPNGELSQGNWLTPTIFSDVDNSSALAQEEVFGPVLAVIPFTTEQEAVSLANDSPYGLSAGIYTTAYDRAFRVAAQLKAGTVAVNGYSFMPNSPFGGVKASGLGREGGRHALDEYLETKTIMMSLGRDASAS